MDIEQLKIIVEMLNKAQGNAATFAFLWLAQQFLNSLLITGMVVYSVIRITRLIETPGDKKEEKKGAK